MTYKVLELVTYEDSKKDGYDAKKDYPYPRGPAERLWRRAWELGQGWFQPGGYDGAPKIKIEIIGQKDYHKECTQCGCKRVHIIRTYDYQHYAKFQCTRCANMVKWASQREC